MNKKELLQAITSELKKVKKQLSIFEEVKAIDFSKFEDKTVSKRIETHIKKELGPNFYVSLTYDLYYDYRIYISLFDEKCPYIERANVEITVYKNKETGGNFKDEELQKQIDQWIEAKKNTIVKLSNEIESIDQAIELYNKMIKAEETASKELSYIFRDSVDFYNRNYRRRIVEE